VDDQAGKKTAKLDERRQPKRQPGSVVVVHREAEHKKAAKEVRAETSDQGGKQ